MPGFFQGKVVFGAKSTAAKILKQLCVEYFNNSKKSQLNIQNFTPALRNLAAVIVENIDYARYQSLDEQAKLNFRTVVVRHLALLVNNYPNSFTSDDKATHTIKQWPKIGITLNERCDGFKTTYLAIKLPAALFEDKNVLNEILKDALKTWEVNLKEVYAYGGKGAISC